MTLSPQPPWPVPIIAAAGRDLGAEGRRQFVAGIAGYYRPEEHGRQSFCGPTWRWKRGVLFQGVLLAARTNREGWP